MVRCKDCMMQEGEVISEDIHESELNTEVGRVDASMSGMTQQGSGDMEGREAPRCDGNAEDVAFAGAGRTSDGQSDVVKERSVRMVVDRPGEEEGSLDRARRISWKEKLCGWVTGEKVGERARSCWDNAKEKACAGAGRT